MMIRILAILNAICFAFFITTTASAQGLDPKTEALVDDAVATAESRLNKLRLSYGNVEFIATAKPQDGRLRVNTTRLGIQNPKADLIAVFDMRDFKARWAWSLGDVEGWSTEIASDVRAYGKQYGYALLDRDFIKLNRPADAYGLGALGIPLSDAQILQDFQYGTVIHYVVLTFDEVAK